MVDKKIIIALDYDSVAEVDSLCNQINPVQCRLKIGKQLFTRYGGNIVKNLQHRDFEIFLDLKFHDIPTTVYKACRAAFDLGVWMLNIHIQGGEKMIEDGLFKLFPADEVYGMHNMPGIRVGEFAVAPGPMMAARDNFEILIQYYLSLKRLSSHHQFVYYCCL